MSPGRRLSVEDSIASAEKPKHTRSREGCLTCRKRKKACDQQRPTCQSCNRLSLDCVWPEDVKGKASMPEVQRLRKRRKIEGEDVPVIPTSSHRRVSGPTVTSPSQTPYQANFQHTVVPTSNVHLRPILNDHSLSYSEQPGFTDWWHPTTAPLNSAAPSVPIPLPPESNSRMQNTMTDQHTFFGSLMPGDHEDDLQSWILNIIGRDGRERNPSRTGTPITASTTSPEGARIDYDIVSSAMDINRGAASIAPDFTSNQAGVSDVADPMAMLTPGSFFESETNMFTQTYLLSHYTNSLARIVSILPDAENTFLDLVPLSAHHPFLLHAILSWSAANLAAGGNTAFAEIADVLAASALATLRELDQSYKDQHTEAVLAGWIMLCQTGICRGDTINWHSAMHSAGDFIRNQGGIRQILKSPLARKLTKNLIYHDVLSSSSGREGMMLDYNEMEQPLQSELDMLMGISERVFRLIARISDLASRKKHLRRGGVDVFDDDVLLEITSGITRLEGELGAEKDRVEATFKNSSDLVQHRWLHEAFRLAALLWLQCVSEINARALPVVTLVRKALSLIEMIWSQGYPGACSIHWVLFIIQINATSLVSPNSLDSAHNGIVVQAETDRQRITKIFRAFEDKYSFANLKRSRDIVEEVWRRNEDGRVFIDYLDICDLWQWRLNFA